MKYIPHIFIGILIIGLIGYIGFLKNSQKTEDTNSNNTSQEKVYFSEDANVMYFYSEDCHYCQEEEPILEELGKQGFRVKPMDVKHDTSAREKFKEYGAQGTPYFYSQKDGDELKGFQELEPLREFLESHR